MSEAQEERFVTVARAKASDQTVEFPWLHLGRSSRLLKQCGSMSDPSDPITRLNAALEGRYRIEREIGGGGMAVVYLAEDLRSGGVVE